MTSSINKNSSIYSEQGIYENVPHSYPIEKRESISDIVDLNDLSKYCSHLDRLFQQTKTNHIYIDPPSIAPAIEKRLFLLDIIRDYANLGSYWESSLRKLDDLPEDISTGEMRKLFEIMANLSQISRDISNRRYQFQKG